MFSQSESISRQKVCQIRKAQSLSNQKLTDKPAKQAINRLEKREMIKLVQVAE